MAITPLKVVDVSNVPTVSTAVLPAPALVELVRLVTVDPLLPASEPMVWFAAPRSSVDPEVTEIELRTIALLALKALAPPAVAIAFAAFVPTFVAPP